MVDFDDIDYFTHADLLYDLAGQMVQYLLGYLSEAESKALFRLLENVIATAAPAS